MSKQVRFHEMKEGKKYKACGIIPNSIGSEAIYFTKDHILFVEGTDKSIFESRCNVSDAAKCFFEEIIEKEKVEWFSVTYRRKYKETAWRDECLYRSKEEFLGEENKEEEYAFLKLELVYTEEV